MYTRFPHNLGDRAHTYWHGDVLFLVLHKSTAILLLITFLPGIFAPFIPTKAEHHETDAKDGHHEKADAHHDTSHDTPKTKSHHSTASRVESDTKWSPLHESHHHEHPDHIEPEEWEDIEREEEKEDKISRSMYAREHVARQMQRGSTLQIDRA